ncbi:TetR/AcrR family transcriptional regulator [Pusillimonas caeni]|uniref:TetR/AcrR family transcriptional regulator n=1 Tax=Pusillimonas caeni TaxID=1348472 RepID=UPI000E59B123|nr:TetR/AcrR family transcriptional regulator [Pusillimonas caeni]TFL13049.1 TetR/AcrR family transcriptional regulator [Pusillimonas caeni]
MTARKTTKPHGVSSFVSANDLQAETDKQADSRPSVKERASKRRAQSDRSRDAKARLLSATIDVLMSRGYNGLTTKEVAKNAGLSNGALAHHYSTKAELVLAATAVVYDECIIRGQRMAKSPESRENPVEGFIADCLSVYFEWPFLAALEVIMVARTDPDLMSSIRPIMLHYRRTTNALWLQVFQEAGYTEEQAKTILNLSLNIIRGMAENRIWQKDEEAYQLYLKEWVKLVKQQYPIGPI